MALFGLGSGRLEPAAARGLNAAALAFSAGTFLCIALSDLLPELQFHEHDRLKLSLALLGGFALMAATAFGEHGHDHDDGHEPAAGRAPRPAATTGTPTP
jgi:zinc and cadmium transporter